MLENVAIQLGMWAYPVEQVYFQSVAPLDPSFYGTSPPSSLAKKAIIFAKVWTLGRQPLTLENAFK